LVESVEEELPEAAVQEVCRGGTATRLSRLTMYQEPTQSTPEVTAPGDVESKVGEPHTAKGEVETLIESKETPPVRGMTEMGSPLQYAD